MKNTWTSYSDAPQLNKVWKQLADDWYQRWKFPHTLRSIEERYMACKTPANSKSTYYNYKDIFSVILFTMVDSDYKFIYIEASDKGSDAKMFNSCDLKEELERNLNMSFTGSEPLFYDTRYTLFRYVLPKTLPHEEIQFNNNRLSMARCTLANRFQILLTTM